MLDFGDDTPNDSSGMDLSSFDKEYILKGLARLYRKKILPLELASKYGHFHSPPMSPADFVAPPMVLLLGQYRYAMRHTYSGLEFGMKTRTLQNVGHVLTRPLFSFFFSFTKKRWKDFLHQIPIR